VEVVASLSRGRTAAAQCGLFTHKSVPVIFEPPFNIKWQSQPPELLCNFIAYENFTNVTAAGTIIQIGGLRF